MLTAKQEVASKRIAQRLWWLLPPDDAVRHLDEIAAEIRDHPEVSPELLDLAVEAIKEDLVEMDRDCGHA